MMKGEKGITLVALIITIIVMIILVGVSIGFALNSDLFGKAQGAVDETKLEEFKEAITLAKADMIAKYYDPNKTATDIPAAYDEGFIEGEINAYLDLKNEEDGVDVTFSSMNATKKAAVFTVSYDDLADQTLELSFWYVETPAEP